MNSSFETPFFMASRARVMNVSHLALYAWTSAFVIGAQRPVMAVPKESWRVFQSGFVTCAALPLLGEGFIPEVAWASGVVSQTITPFKATKYTPVSPPVWLEP